MRFLPFHRTPQVAAACLFAALGLAIAPHAHAQTEERVKIEPYTGPPIFLDEKKVVVPPTIINVEPASEKYPDSDQLRIERQVAKYSDNHFKPHGYYREYHPNGKPFITGQFKEGRQDGEWVYYYENGQINRRVNYQNGKLHGVWEMHRPDGTLAAERSFESGLRDGTWILYDDTGKQKLLEENYAAGKLHGPAKMWYPNGQLRREMAFKESQRHGLIEEYKEDGTKVNVISYLDGKLEGTTTVTRPDGSKLIQEYKAGRLVSERKE
jgi:antitoxin component YwqK of YwqJK toxin-antitoxin module